MQRGGCRSGKNHGIAAESGDPAADYRLYRQSDISAVFTPLYDRLLSKNSNLDLNIQSSHHSSELYGPIKRTNIDIGFVYHKLHYKNIITEKLFEEKLYLIQSDTPEVPAVKVHTDELDLLWKLFLSWDDNYQLCMTAGFQQPPDLISRQITITLLDRLWKKPGNWMIAPISVILEFARFRPLYISELKNQPPNRVCYKIKHRYPKITGKRAVEFFENALDEYMADSS